MKKFGINQSKVASRVVHGPGSMFGEAEALREARASRFGKAADLLEEHHRQIPKTAHSLPRMCIDEWRRYATQSIKD